MCGADGAGGGAGGGMGEANGSDVAGLIDGAVGVVGATGVAIGCVVVG